MPLCALVAAILAASSSPLWSETIELFPHRDNTLFSESPDRSNGAGAFLFAGLTGKDNPRRALLTFAIAESLPADATITAISLTLFMDRTKAETCSISLHRILEPWGEAGSDAIDEEGVGIAAQSGDATWSHAFFDSLEWTQSGGTFDPTPSAVRQIDTLGAYTWESTPALIGDVKGWLEDPSSNFGWLLLGDESLPPPTAKRFGSRQHPDPAMWPLLTVDYFVDEVVIDPPQPDRSREVDFDNSGTVDLSDFFLFADQFDQPVTAQNDIFDLNQDGLIGLSDFFIFADNFGKTILDP